MSRARFGPGLFCGLGIGHAGWGRASAGWVGRGWLRKTVLYVGMCRIELVASHGLCMRRARRFWLGLYRCVNVDGDDLERCS